MADIIRTYNLTKRFGEKIALNSLYFEEVPSVGVTAVTTEMQQICDAQNEEVSICLPVQ